MSRTLWLTSGIIVLALAVLAVNLIVLPPKDFPTHLAIEISAGTSTGQVAADLKNVKIINSPTAFALWARLSGAANKIQAGLYEFNQPLSLFGVVRRLAAGEGSDAPIKLTIPEGWDAAKIATAVKKSFPDLDQAEFEALALEHQGYLFPATYLVPAHATAEQIIALMTANFSTRTVVLKKELTDSPHSLDEIVRLASLVETEAADPTDRRLIAGILWKRFAAGHKLEVDVATSTYDVLGLPPVPIANPSFDALVAALEPQPSDYWFYLSDKTGMIHYAKDYEEHKRNITRFY